VPSTVATSTGKQHHFEESIYSLYSTNNIWTYNGSCATGTWDAGTYTVNNYYNVKASGYARRFVFGLSLKACWQLSGYGIPFLRLSAKVFYKDWCNFVNVAQLDTWSAFTGAPSRYRLLGDLTTCSTIAAVPGYGSWVCGTGSWVEPADATIPNPTQCLDCDPATVPNTTNQPILIPLNCTVETIERTIDIPTDSACSIVGTHVFNGPSEQPTKFQIATGCLTSGLLGCEWRYPTTDCPGINPFPTSASGSRAAFGDETRDFTSLAFNNSASNAITNYRDSGDGRALMKWWTEPWLITIS
jgi:hypothetical protein